MAKEYKIPNSTVGRKISERTPLPKTLVKGSNFSKSKEPSSGHTVGCGSETKKIAYPPMAPSPPAKNDKSWGMPSPPAKK